MGGIVADSGARVRSQQRCPPSTKLYPPLVQPPASSRTLDPRTEGSTRLGRPHHRAAVYGRLNRRRLEPDGSWCQGPKSVVAHLAVCPTFWKASMRQSTSEWTVRMLTDLRERIDTESEYQRGQVWSVAQRRLLIDSLLRGYDIPKIYLRKLPDGGSRLYEVVDGKQRLTAIWGFLGMSSACRGTSISRVSASWDARPGMSSLLPPRTVFSSLRSQ
jgi:hypothetical protein